jgi:ribulose bisphosphate carboxylase small subunit
MKKKQMHYKHKMEKKDTLERIDRDKVSQWISSVKVEAYGAEEAVKWPKNGINTSDKHYARLVSDPKSNRQMVEFIIKEDDMEIKYFKPFAPG